MLAHTLHPTSWGERIAPAVEAEARTRHDQLVDACRVELFQQAGDVIVDAMPGELAIFQERSEIGEAAQVDADSDARIEGGQPPGLGGSHRQPKDAQSRRIDLR